MKLTDLVGFAARLPAVVGGIMGIVSKVKTANKDAKIDAVLNAVPDALIVAEFGVGKDLLDDAAVKAAITAVATAKHDLIVAEEALRAAITKKAA